MSVYIHEPMESPGSTASAQRDGAVRKISLHEFAQLLRTKQKGII
jgi:hypothetical protein